MESDRVIFKTSDLPQFSAIMMEEARMVRNITAFRSLILFVASWALVLALPKFAIYTIVGTVISAIIFLTLALSRFARLKLVKRYPLSVTEETLHYRGSKIPVKSVVQARLIRFQGSVELIVASTGQLQKTIRILPLEFMDTPQFLRAISSVGIAVARVER